ncbi:hypothetical protein L228DRAFT_244964 [Xylona heveae TC161]|uniref:Autophagy-related protein 27 n=1 Tax=Xylona heveae (strain CBS 132557 / TC161) TaxID=1328760 RepID=A0A165HY57_XYLHT|nr:hypothetical protein L228DRAFT_244964 [Xylona heveae TC161]KZF24090.1 hypothetical protein L228DRAFT_244964 [Xylona heveae TC161]
MRLSRDAAAVSAFSLLQFASLSSAITFDCEHVVVEGKSFDLSPLSGPHSVSWVRPHPPSLYNTTFTVDVCKPLKRTKGVPKDEECPSGTRVCGIERIINKEEDKDVIGGVYPIAGDFIHESRPLDARVTRLKSSTSDDDADKEGVRLELNGGKFPFSSHSGRKQKAVVEFLCDADRTGLELDEPSSDEKDSKKDEKKDDEEEEKSKRSSTAAVEKADDSQDDLPDDDEDDDKNKSNASLQFVSYGAEQDIDVLYLEWRTKYACEGIKNGDDNDNKDQPKQKGSWGFFTWLIIVVFLGIAAYLIFGSWLNYNRYGARGWDLLPHGDSIRDIPYLLRDWTRRVISTVQGGGSRGGYSAV